MSDSSFTVNALIGLPLDCHYAAEDQVYSSLWEFHHVFFLSFTNRKRRVLGPLGKPKKIKHSHPQTTWKQNGRPNNPWLHSKWSWGNITFAIFVFCPIYHIMRFLKKLRSLRATKVKAVKAVDVYIWISFSGYMSKSPS